MRVQILPSSLLAAVLLAAGCSSNTGTTPSVAIPATSPTQAATVGSTSQQRETLDLHGFPIALHGFPIALHGFPICQQQKTNQTVLCHASLYTNVTPSPYQWLPSFLLQGLQPNALQTHYLGNTLYSRPGVPRTLPGVTSAHGTGQTIAVVVAYTNPNLEHDLAAYRTEFGIPACTQQNGCLKFTGAATQIDPAQGWPREAALDAEVISAMCPACHITVVQATDDTLGNLAAAEDVALASGATVVSNSWSLPESPGALGYRSHFNHPGIPIVAGAGDAGFGVAFPADLPTVIAVGGTTYSSAGPSQDAIWGLTGGGCSAYVAKPSWQTDTGCNGRTMNDVSVVGDPVTGVAAYSTEAGGWVVNGGTSIGAPLVSAMYALAGNTQAVNDASALYRAGGGAFYQVASGSNGYCAPAYLCSAQTGYSAPAGLGTPNTNSVFQHS